MNTLSPFHVLNTTEIAAILDNLSRATVAVVGDFCLDVYWNIDRSATEQSVETGVWTEPVRIQTYAPGGAGNVVMNLIALGVARIHPIGILGNDPFARELIRLLRHPHVHLDGLLVQDHNWATHSYVKPHVGQQELSRLDHGNFNHLSRATEDLFFIALEKALTKVSTVLINHQVIGSIHDSDAFRRRLSAVIEKHTDVCFIVDSRGHHGAYPRAIHKLNDREVMRASGAEVSPDQEISLADLVEHARILRSRWESPLVVTRGALGCVVFDEAIPQRIFGIQLMGKTDSVGAGDTFVSALTAISSTGTRLTGAAFVANIAAAVTTKKTFQTGTASPSEILGLASKVHFTHHPELAAFPHKAKYFESTEIEIIEPCPPSLNIRHAIFDHDGTISTLREGWEQIMEPMMVRAILGEEHKTSDTALFQRVKARVKDFIEMTTGIQTIAQMQGLVDLVREFGIVPQNEVLDAKGYKKLYNATLQELVNRRLRKLDGGELAISDFTVKGAVDFLKRLHRAQVRLYLASGTDDADVKSEATRLGYAELFNGGIHGSLGDIEQDAKKVVLARILSEIGPNSLELVTFGDGPVEIRETIRNKGYAIGLASDEVRRFGSNFDKRSRLIRAGACAIIPDFSQADALWRYLQLPVI